ncbi:hypothetical protein IGI37_001923 [Enterococcus sp. AZ194]
MCYWKKGNQFMSSIKSNNECLVRSVETSKKSHERTGRFWFGGSDNVKERVE